MNELGLIQDLSKGLIDQVQILLEALDARIKLVEEKERAFNVYKKELQDREVKHQLALQHFEEEKGWIKKERINLQEQTLILKQREAKLADIDEKLKLLDDREYEVKEKESSLIKKEAQIEQLKSKTAALEQKEREIQKQITIDQKRKELLSIKEQRVDTELERLQKISAI